MPDRTATELLATLREVLSNVARHAQASQAEIEVSVRDDLHLRVLHDGVGTDPSHQSTGKGLRGSFRFLGRDGGWTEVSWRVPLSVGREGLLCSPQRLDASVACLSHLL